MRKLILYLIQLVCLHQHKMLAQQVTNLDSLLSVFNHCKTDSDKVKAGINIALQFKNKNTDSSLKWIELIKDLSLKSFPVKLGSIYQIEGSIYWDKNDYTIALEKYLLSLAEREKTGDEKGIAASYNNIGRVYDQFGQEDKAMLYFRKANSLANKLGVLNLMAGSCNNIGSVFYRSNKDSALIYFNLSKNAFQKLGNSDGVALALQNIGNIYVDKNNNEKALEILEEAILIYEKLNNKIKIASTLVTVSDVYTNQKNYAKALSLLEKSRKILTAGNVKNFLSKNYEAFYKTYYKMKDYKNALEFHLLYINLKDSIMGVESIRKISQIQASYESEKKDKEIQLLNKEKEKQSALALQERKNRKVILLSVCGFACFVMIFALFIFRSYRQKQRINMSLEIKNKIIEEKQKEILDSIHYAKRIQNALITNEKYFIKNLK